LWQVALLDKAGVFSAIYWHAQCVSFKAEWWAVTYKPTCVAISNLGSITVSGQ